MKLPALLLAGLGLVAGRSLYGWNDSKEHHYAYYGKMLTGIPDIDHSSYTGLSLSTNIIAQTTGKPDTFKIALKDVFYGSHHDKLSGAEAGWRAAEAPATNMLSSEHQAWLESPVEFVVKDGKITSMSVAGGEPHWSVNFKKALLGSGIAGVKDNKSYWTEMQEGIEGKCENTYQVSELPEYLVTEAEYSMIKPELCVGKKYYQILKTKDITKCEDRSMFLYSKAHKNCLLGNCLHTKNSVTRYFGCGESTTSFVMHGMINEGETRHSVLAYSTEEVVTGTSQKYQLTKVLDTITTVLPEITAPRSTNLMYEFPQSEQKVNQLTSRADPANQVFLPAGSSKHIVSSKTAANKALIVAKLKTVATELGEYEHFGKKEIPSQLKALKTVLSIMTTEDLKEIFNMLEGLSCSAEIKQTAKSLYLEMVRNAGTSPCFMFLKELIEKNMLTEAETFIIVATLAHHIKTPTEETIQEIFHLIRHPAVASKPWIKTIGHIAFATIVRKSCLASPGSQVYPEQVFGKMCSPHYEKITTEYIPHLVAELSAASGPTKISGLTALGELGHESTVPLMLSYIEGKAAGTTPATRKMAIYALFEVTKKYKSYLLPVYSSLIHNPAEERGIRIAALAMLLRMEPSSLHMQKLAVSTWYEKDGEFCKFVYSTLKSLAYLNYPSHHLEQGELYLSSLSAKAKAVLPLAKPVPGVISSTFYTFLLSYLPNLGVGTGSETALISGTTGQALYHKTEYFLKQLTTIPIEFAVHYSGVKSIAKSIIKSMPGYTKSIHPELESIISKLSISPRVDSAFEAGMWMKLSDDITLDMQANIHTFESMKEEMAKTYDSCWKDPKACFCKKKPFNLNNMFEELPYQALIPTDLGFPIIVETQMTYLTSLKGEVELECSSALPHLKLDLIKKIAYTYNGYVGTVSPFTGELLAAGINIHRSTNLPFSTKAKLDGKAGALMLKVEQLSKTPSNIDIHHYHVKPFLAKKPLVFKDLTPMILHADTMILKSAANMKSIETSFGSELGIMMNLKLDTESDLYDAKSIMYSWENYKYNPLLAGLLSFTETAMTSHGKPSGRYHEYTLSHSPAESSTTGAEVSIKLGWASKKGSQPAQVYNVHGYSQQLGKQSVCEKMLHKCIDKLSSSANYAVHTEVIASLLGESGQVKSSSYHMTTGLGLDSLEHKWNIHLQTDDAKYAEYNKICMDGSLKFPVKPEAESKFNYHNYIGFGSTCQDHTIHIDGHTVVSSQQTEYSSKSQEAKYCKHYTEKAGKLWEKIMSYGSDQAYQVIKKEHSVKYAEVASKKEKYCAIKMEQSKTLDTVEFTIKTSANLPVGLYTAGKVIDSGLKAMLMEYITGLPAPSAADKITANIKFNTELNTATLNLITPLDSASYSNIRLPYATKHFLPLIYDKKYEEQVYQAVSGSTLYPKCVVGKGYVNTFDKKVYSYGLDSCQHVLASDCSDQFTHAVLAKEVNGLKEVTVYSGDTKLVVKPASTYTAGHPTFEVYVDGALVDCVKHEWTKVASSSYGEYWVKVSHHHVTISSPHSRVRCAGHQVSVEEKVGMMDGSHCGLCGDYNGDKKAEVKSPRGCSYSSYQAAARSYKVESSSCSAMSSAEKAEQVKEDSKCVVYSQAFTPVSKIYTDLSSSSYYIKQHEYIYKESEICFSNIPVVRCVVGSKPKAMVSKSVGYVCLPVGRLSKVYASRIDRGESPQELRHQPVSWAVQVEQPVSCMRPQI